MGYFTLKVKSPSRGIIYETDFPADMFEHIIQGVLYELINKNKIFVGDQCQARIIPGYDDSPDYEKETFIDTGDREESKTQKENLGENYIDVEFKNDTVTNTPLKYFTLKLFVYNRNLIYMKNFHPVQLRFIDSVITMLIRKGKLAAKEDYFSEIIPREGDGSSINFELDTIDDPAPASIPLKIDFYPLDTNSTPVNQCEDDDGISDLITLESEEQQIPVEIKTKKISSYNILKEVGKVGDDDLKIFIKQETIKKLEEVTCPSVGLGKELIGILVGDVYQDQDTGEMFVEINNIIPAPQAPAGFCYAILDNAALNAVNDRLNEKFPNKLNVGWYHTHLIKMFHLSKENIYYNIKKLPSTFFSGDDYFLHQHFFKQPWHVAIVIEPEEQDMTIFQWKKGNVEPCGGYFVFKENNHG